jgi:hypothetical protein
MRGSGFEAASGFGAKLRFDFEGSQPLRDATTFGAFVAASSVHRIIHCGLTESAYLSVKIPPLDSG